MTSQHEARLPWSASDIREGSPFVGRDIPRRPPGRAGFSVIPPLSWGTHRRPAVTLVDLGPEWLDLFRLVGDVRPGLLVGITPTSVVLDTVCLDVLWSALYDVERGLAADTTRAAGITRSLAASLRTHMMCVREAHIRGSVKAWALQASPWFTPRRLPVACGCDMFREIMIRA
jgi:hypothetical protein